MRDNGKRDFRFNIFFFSFQVPNGLLDKSQVDANTMRMVHVNIDHFVRTVDAYLYSNSVSENGSRSESETSALSSWEISSSTVFGLRAHLWHEIFARSFLRSDCIS